MGNNLCLFRQNGFGPRDILRCVYLGVWRWMKSCLESKLRAINCNERRNEGLKWSGVSQASRNTALAVRTRSWWIWQNQEGLDWIGLAWRASFDKNVWSAILGRALKGDGYLLLAVPGLSYELAFRGLHLRSPLCTGHHIRLQYHHSPYSVRSMYLPWLWWEEYVVHEG